ncbi:protein unc-93 homolog A [Lingula anatina]|uniref:Protein unc-93 homolog A n=1 Tax=Lingula anatina TaxID=7574 RepID=A0A1S3H2L0_LINAN|nr:protein unc-93 homolog A [Lingula anatina]|eukprot:XP_013379716.2 protein unc-93 homolog A [Lingula anatina]
MPPNSRYVTCAHEDGSATPLLLAQPGKTHRSKWKPVSQLVILSLVYMIGYAPFDTMWNLEGILFPEYGYYALMCTYLGSFLIFLVGPFLTRKLGSKGSIMLGWVAQAAYVAAHFYIQPYLLYTVCILFGTAHCQSTISTGVYVTHLAMDYADITHDTPHHALGLFQGVFFTVYLLSGVWGNLVSSLVLVKPIEFDGNSTTPNSKNLSSLCGPNFCHFEDTSGTYIRQPDQITVYILLGSFIGMSALALFTTGAFLENAAAKSGDAVQSVKEFGAKIIGLLWYKKMLLLLPGIFLFSISQYFIHSEFTKAFVSCELGIEYNGWSIICFAMGDFFGSVVNGRLVKYVGMAFLFLVAAATDFVCLFSMLFFHFSRETVEFFFLVPFFWGLADSIWAVQITAYIGKLFPDEKWPAFLIQRSSMYALTALLFAITNFICLNAMIYTVMGIITCGLVCLTAFELLHRHGKKHYTAI